MSRSYILQHNNIKTRTKSKYPQKQIPSPASKQTRTNNEKQTRRTKAANIASQGNKRKNHILQTEESQVSPNQNKKQKQTEELGVASQEKSMIITIKKSQLPRSEGFQKPQDKKEKGCILFLIY